MLAVPLFLFAVIAGCDDSLKPAAEALQGQNPQGALSLLEPLRSRCTQSGAFLELLGLSNELLNNQSDAEKALRGAVALDNKSPRLLTELGATLLRNGKPAEAAKPLKQALALDPSNLVILKYAVGASVGAHDWHSASDLFARLDLEKNNHLLQDEPILLLWLAQTLLETKQPARLDTVLSHAPASLPPGLSFSLGTLLAQHEMYTRAVDFLNLIPSEAADDAVYFNLGLCYSHLQRWNEARAEYFEAIDKHPAHTDAYLHIGLDYVTSGQPRLGIPWLYKADTLSNSRPDIAYALADQLIRLQYFDSAKQILAASEQTASDEPLLLVANGNLRQAQADSTGALVSYNKALAEKPGFVPALAGIARADTAANKTADAKTLLTDALAHNPHDPTLNRELGLLEAHEGNWTVAADHLARAWSQNHSDPQVALQLARAYSQENRSQDALKLLQSLAPEVEDSGPFHYQLAQLYTALHRPAEAQAEREQVAAIRARSEDVLHFENPRTYVH